MEGSPVRGQDKPRHTRLNEAQDIQSFQSELVRQVAAELANPEVFFGLVDTTSKVLQLPVWVKTHFERHPALYEKLDHGELVGISYSEDDPTPRPINASRSNVLLVPVISDTALHGVIGVSYPTEGRHLLHEDLEALRQFAHDAGTVLARLQEIERLRQLNQELAATVERIVSSDKRLTDVIERKNALIGMRSHLQSNVAHDLRTPLAAIRGYTRMILDGRAGEINETQSEYLQIIVENTNRLINLVSWMSRMANISVQQFHLDSFDLRDVWTECVKASEHALNQKSIKLEQHIPDEPFLLMGDREKFVYVFTYLLATAMQFSNTEATIVATFLHGKEREITVKISESTSVIPPEALVKISERPLNAIPVLAAGGTSGRGLSLSGVYDIIGMHGGRFFVSSKTGQGSTFLFTMPAVAFDGEEKSGNEQALNFGSRRR